MVAATHAVVPDTRNASILIGMRDGMSGEFRLVPREQATVSVFDSAFMLGDGIWEGIRSKQGVIQFAKDHLNRLFESAKAMCELPLEMGANSRYGSGLYSSRAAGYDPPDYGCERKSHVDVVG